MIKVEGLCEQVSLEEVMKALALLNIGKAAGSSGMIVGC